MRYLEVLKFHNLKEEDVVLIETLPEFYKVRCKKNKQIHFLRY